MSLPEQYAIQSSGGLKNWPFAATVRGRQPKLQGLVDSLASQVFTGKELKALTVANGGRVLFLPHEGRNIRTNFRVKTGTKDDEQHADKDEAVKKFVSFTLYITLFEILANTINLVQSNITALTSNPRTNPKTLLAFLRLIRGFKLKGNKDVMEELQYLPADKLKKLMNTGIEKLGANDLPQGVFFSDAKDAGDTDQGRFFGGGSNFALEADIRTLAGLLLKESLKPGAALNGLSKQMKISFLGPLGVDPEHGAPVFASGNRDQIVFFKDMPIQNICQDELEGLVVKLISTLKGQESKIAQWAARNGPMTAIRTAAAKTENFDLLANVAVETSNIAGGVSQGCEGEIWYEYSPDGADAKTRPPRAVPRFIQGADGRQYLNPDAKVSRCLQSAGAGPNIYGYGTNWGLNDAKAVRKTVRGGKAVAKKKKPAAAAKKPVAAKQAKVTAKSLSGHLTKQQLAQFAAKVLNKK